MNLTDDLSFEEATLEQSVNNTSNLLSFRYFGITIGFIDILVGAFGNLITILAVMRNAKLRNQPFNLFVANLSAIDLLTSLVMMPFNVTGYIMASWPYGMKTCILQAFFYFSCGYTSVVFLIAITINRLIGIAYPERYRFVSTNCVKVSVFICWIVAPTFLFPFLVVSLHAYHTEQTLITGWKKEQFLCTFIHMEGDWWRYMLFLRFLFQFLPVFVIAFSYAYMYFCIRQSIKRAEANALPYMGNSRKYKRGNREDEEFQRHVITWCRKAERKKRKDKLSFLKYGQVYEVQGKEIVVKSLPLRKTKRKDSLPKKHREEIHLVHVSIIVCAAFTILFLPSFLINLIPGSRNFDPRIHMAASNLTWLNSCVNPFIYAIRHKPMRKEYKAVLKGIRNYIEKLFCKIQKMKNGLET